MSIRKNTWNLDEHYDLTKDGQNTYSSVDTGSLFMWGRIAASGGQLAQNDNVQRSSPTQVPGSWTNNIAYDEFATCLLYTSPSPRDGLLSRMPSSA